MSTTNQHDVKQDFAKRVYCCPESEVLAVCPQAVVCESFELAFATEELENFALDIDFEGWSF